MVAGSAPSVLRRGQVVNARYRVEEVIGRGGMSVVARATDLQTSRAVALKVLHRQRWTRDKDVARLQREARAVGQLASPHAARLYEADAFVEHGVTVPYLVLECVDGVDLATWLHAKGSFDAAAAATVIIQACEALGEAHACGLVHRDVKPANLMLTSSPAGTLFVKVLDFGIARQLIDDERLTTSGEVVGSPMYMAPEQMRPDAALDASADVWSLGVVLYELITGRLPFASTSLPELCLKVMFDEPEPLPASCSADVAAVIARCLRKEPSARFESARHVAEALRAAAAPSVPLSTADLELATVAAASDDSAEPPPTRSRPRRWPAVVAVGVAAAASIALWPRGASNAPARVTTPPTATRSVTGDVVAAPPASLLVPSAPVVVPSEPVATPSGPAARPRARTRALPRHAVDDPIATSVAPAPSIATTTSATVPPPPPRDPLASPF